jgi:nitroreductase
MKINIPIEETIKKRKSVRTYEERKLSIEDKEKLIAFADNLSNPFGEKVKFHLIEKTTEPNGEKLGTYGVIKGASSFIGASVSNTEFGLEAVGYEFENLILYATHMGLGTVWLAATFSRDSFSSAMGIKEDELFPAISPVGYLVEKKRLKESIMRKIMKSDQRKPWNKLFFKNNFSTPLTEKEAGVYAVPLEMLRLAPSATNAQPWRIVKDSDIFHFYETHNSNTGEDEKLIKRVDVGIGIGHFHQTALERGLTGKFEKRSQQNMEIPQNTKYIVSWVPGKE